MTGDRFAPQQFANTQETNGLRSSLRRNCMAQSTGHHRVTKRGDNETRAIGKTPMKRNQIAGQILFWLSFAMIVYILLGI